jgi:hypothetical protein
MMRSSAYNRFGGLLGTSWPASCPRWYGLREDALPMITLFPSQGDFYATAFEETTHLYNIQRLKRAQGLSTIVEVPPVGYWVLDGWDRSEP